MTSAVLYRGIVHCPLTLFLSAAVALFRVLRVVVVNDLAVDGRTVPAFGMREIRYWSLPHHQPTAI